MSPTQFAKLLSDYGPIVAIIAFLVAFVALLVVLWKPLSKFVLAVNTILVLPTTLQEQDDDSAIKKEMITALDTKITAHIAESEARAMSMGELQREVKALGQAQEDIIHEVKPNSGGSLKDQMTRTESMLREVLTRLDKPGDTLSGR